MKRAGPAVFLTLVSLLLFLSMHAREVLILGYLPWYAKYSKEQVKEYGKKYDVLGAQLYFITPSGDIKVKNNALHEILQVNQKTKVMPVLVLQEGAGSGKFLKDPALRRQAAQSVADFCRHHDFDRIQFDFEYMPSSWNIYYQKFLQSVKRNYPSLFISVAIAPPLDTDKRYAGFFDVETLDSAADEFMLMAYDYYGPLRKNGPVTSLAWAEKNLKYLLEKVEPSKIILGAPLYGYGWTGDGKRKTFTERSFYKTFPQQEIIRLEEGVISLKNPGKYNYVYISAGDTKTVELFRSLALKYGLKGVGIWRLGFERE